MFDPSPLAGRIMDGLREPMWRTEMPTGFDLGMLTFDGRELLRKGMGLNVEVAVRVDWRVRLGLAVIKLGCLLCGMPMTVDIEQMELRTDDANE